MNLRIFSLLFFAISLAIQSLPYKFGWLPEFSGHEIYGYNGMVILTGPALWLGYIVAFVVFIFTLVDGNKLDIWWKKVCFAGCISLMTFATLVLIYWFPHVPRPATAIGTLLLFVPPMSYLLEIGKWINKKYDLV